MFHVKYVLDPQRRYVEHLQNRLFYMFCAVSGKIGNDFVIVVDDAQNKVFQLSLNVSTDFQASIVYSFGKDFIKT